MNDDGMEWMINVKVKWWIWYVIFINKFYLTRIFLACLQMAGELFWNSWIEEECHSDDFSIYYILNITVFSFIIFKNYDSAKGGQK